MMVLVYLLGSQSNVIRLGRVVRCGIYITGAAGTWGTHVAFKIVI
ncbi:MAG: Unknown protein [uncultured Aureispira sp.]|uniref:Uncharacterized protein n=1 Tax=uncultured Aureispira sp. TaxID=1331704 RepID=A0A6S6SFK7_9BACT|nr:MAG: Unknown protein [uncultured Aureispira sp.]